MKPTVVIGLTLLIGTAAICRADDRELRQRALQGLRRAVTFYHKDVSTQGGYVWRYSSDLALREGEAEASSTTIWVEPPGTPAVGLAFLRAWERTGEAYLLEAALDAGKALVRGQLHSGGWNDGVYFDAETRRKHAYFIEGPPAAKARNVSTLDDNRSQAALLFLARLDKATGLSNDQIHGSAMRAIEGILGAQHPNGAWSQAWTGPVPREGPADRRASFPDDWPRTHPGGQYWRHYTLNDNAISDTIETLLEISAIYDDPRIREAAVRGGEFLIRAQLPEPQPAWAQQYNTEMHPAWARKFEPPAVSAGESQRVIPVLIRLYRATGDARFKDAVPPALAWLKRSLLPDGRLARFYELKTNRPLYMTSDYRLTYEDTDLPTHYAFKVVSELPRLEKALAAADQPAASHVRPPTAAAVEAVLGQMDQRGAWVEEGRLRAHKLDGPVIQSATFIRNIDVLSAYVARPSAK